MAPTSFLSALRGLFGGKPVATVPPDFTPATQFAENFETPQGAVRMLERAYREGNVDAAVAARDFRREARLMLATGPLRGGADAALVAETARVVETAYRTHAQSAGLPSLEGAVCYLGPVTEHSPDVVIVPEAVQLPDASIIQQRLLVSRSKDGWRVLHPL